MSAPAARTKPHRPTRLAEQFVYAECVHVLTHLGAGLRRKRTRTLHRILALVRSFDATNCWAPEYELRSILEWRIDVELRQRRRRHRGKP